MYSFNWIWKSANKKNKKVYSMVIFSLFRISKTCFNKKNLHNYLNFLDKLLSFWKNFIESKFKYWFFTVFYIPMFLQIFLNQYISKINLLILFCSYIKEKIITVLLAVTVKWKIHQYIATKLLLYIIIFKFC